MHQLHATWRQPPFELALIELVINLLKRRYTSGGDLAPMVGGDSCFTHSRVTDGDCSSQSDKLNDLLALSYKSYFHIFMHVTHDQSKTLD